MTVLQKSCMIEHILTSLRKWTLLTMELLTKRGLHGTIIVVGSRGAKQTFDHINRLNEVY